MSSPGPVSRIKWGCRKVALMFTIFLTSKDHGDVHRVIATRSLSWSKLSNRSPLAKSLIRVRRLIRANSMIRVRVILSNIWTVRQNTKEGTWHSQSIWTMRSFHKVLNRPKVTNEALNHLHGRVRLLNEVFSKKLRRSWPF